MAELGFRERASIQSDISWAGQSAAQGSLGESLPPMVPGRLRGQARGVQGWPRGEPGTRRALSKVLGADPGTDQLGGVRIGRGVRPIRGSRIRAGLKNASIGDPDPPPRFELAVETFAGGSLTCLLLGGRVGLDELLSPILPPRAGAMHIHRNPGDIRHSANRLLPVERAGRAGKGPGNYTERLDLREIVPDVLHRSTLQEAQGPARRSAFGGNSTCTFRAESAQVPSRFRCIARRHFNAG